MICTLLLKIWTTVWTTSEPNLRLFVDGSDLLSTPPVDQINSKLLNAVASDSIEDVLLPFGVDSSHGAGVLWNFGKFLKTTSTSDPWLVTLRVIDLSYCDQTEEIAAPTRLADLRTRRSPATRQRFWMGFSRTWSFSSAFSRSIQMVLSRIGSSTGSSCRHITPVDG